MWEIPHAPLIDREDQVEAVVRVVKELTGLDVQAGKPVLTINHTVTRYRIRLACVEAKLVRGRFKSAHYSAAEWLTLEELGKHPVSSPQRRLIWKLGERVQKR
jgi:hypothetical protein